MSLPSTAAVIGFGRFGRLWASILRDDFDVRVHDTEAALRAEAAARGFASVPVRDALDAEVIFYCVPISAFEATIREHVRHLAEAEGPRTLVAMLSVKLHPRDVFERHLPAAHRAMLAHPLFGPDSVAASGLTGQP